MSGFEPVIVAWFLLWVIATFLPIKDGAKTVIGLAVLTVVVIWMLLSIGNAMQLLRIVKLGL